MQWNSVRFLPGTATYVKVFFTAIIKYPCSQALLLFCTVSDEKLGGAWEGGLVWNILEIFLLHYIRANVLLSFAGQIPKLPKTASPSRTLTSPNRTPASVNTAHSVEQRPNKKKMAKFDPNKTVFCSVSEIPDELLADIARCFQHRMLICRMCYFVSNCNEFSSKMSSRNTCERGHPWKHIRVITMLHMFRQRWNGDERWGTDA